MNEREELTQRLDLARSEVKFLVDHLDGKTDIYPNWKLKNLIDHFAGWDDAVIASFSAHIKGDPVPLSAVRGINPYNAETVSTRETIPYQHSLREWEISRETLKQLIREAPDEKLHEAFTAPWNGQLMTIAQIVTIWEEHEKEHAEEIRHKLNL